MIRKMGYIRITRPKITMKTKSRDILNFNSNENVRKKLLYYLLDIEQWKIALNQVNYSCNNKTYKQLIIVSLKCIITT